MPPTRMSVNDELNPDQKKRVEAVHQAYLKTRPDYIYWEVVRDESYAPRGKFRVIAYPVSAAVPSKWFCGAASIEEAIITAELEMKIDPAPTNNTADPVDRLRSWRKECTSRRWSINNLQSTDEKEVWNVKLQVGQWDDPDAIVLRGTGSTENEAIDAAFRSRLCYWVAPG